MDWPGWGFASKMRDSCHLLFMRVLKKGQPSGAARATIPTYHTSSGAAIFLFYNQIIHRCMGALHVTTE